VWLRAAVILAFRKIGGVMMKPKKFDLAALFLLPLLVPSLVYVIHNVPFTSDITYLTNEGESTNLTLALWLLSQDLEGGAKADIVGVCWHDKSAGNMVLKYFRKQHKLSYPTCHQ
jgi:hypothetical protein